MATVLENYYGYRQQLLQRMAQPPISPADLWLYGEILYRIGVLETCQMYLRSAPITRITGSGLPAFSPRSLRLIRRRLAGSSRHCCLRGCSTGTPLCP